MIDVNISFATDPGSKTTPNEDAVVAAPNVVAVVDGVSAPKDLSTGCMHGTPWYANSLGARIVATVSRDPELDLRSALFEALKLVAESHANTCDLSSDGTPSGTVAIVRQRQDFLDYLVLSDAVIAFKAEKGVEVVADKRVDSLVGHLVREAKAAPVGTGEHERRVASLISAQRKLRNVEGGYWLAGAVPEAANHALVGTVDRHHTHNVAVMTDGAASLVDLYQAMSWEDAMVEFSRDSPGAWIRRVREVEATDPDGVRWPRFKAGDDATVAFCDVS